MNTKPNVPALRPSFLPRAVGWRRILLSASVVAIGLQAAPASVDVKPAQPVIPERRFTLKDFGGIGDGRTLNTIAFQRAIAAVKAAGGGHLIVAPGDYLTAPISLCSNLRLELEAGSRLLFVAKPEDYTTERGSLLAIDGQHDVTIAGRGVIDGQGQPWWRDIHRLIAEEKVTGVPRVEKKVRPWMVVAKHSQRVRVEGVTLQHSPMFQCVFIACEDVTVDGIKILAPNNPEDHAFNTDGIDPIGSRRVLITRCDIDTGDDCIALKANRRDGAVEDVLITDCIFRNGHGCSIGSSTGPAVRNVTVRNCTFEGTEIGIRTKASRERGGVVENILYTDITMNNVRWPIVITSYYPGQPPPLAQRNTAQPVTLTTPIWRNITIRNVVARNADWAGHIIGLPEMPAENITLENVTIEAKTGMSFEQINGLTLKNVHIKTPQGDGIEIAASVTSGAARSRPNNP